MGSTYKSASKSHVGMVRQVNEDACLDLPENRLWVVADGMGGHAAGDYVSSLIVDSLRTVPLGRSLDEYAAALRNDLIRINAAVREETANRGVTLMGSTVVLLAARGLRGVCVWAGDSRLYRLRDGVLERISRDHSYVQDLQDSGLLSEADARTHPRSNIVTRAIGVEAQLDVASVDLLIAPGDSYLLRTISSGASWLSTSRISWSSTVLLRPSLHSRNTSPGRVSSSSTSRFNGARPPTARVNARASGWACACSRLNCCSAISRSSSE